MAKRLPRPYTIVGGRDAKLGEVPWMVDIHTSTGHYCGGSILDKQTVITAAHCVYGKNSTNLHIKVGSLNRNLGGLNISVASIIQHELYNRSITDYDIALLKLSSDIPIDGKTIAAVNLPPAHSDPQNGQNVLVAGWGRTQFFNDTLPNTLQLVNVNIVNRDNCKRDLKSFIVTDRMVCAGDAGGKDACGGDSGGPLTHNNTLVGIVSWGSGCADKGIPGVYSRVGYFVDWIQSHRN